ncbi:hypothetical protein ABH898_002083 [Paenibacillus sp. RC82]
MVVEEVWGNAKGSDGRITQGGIMYKYDMNMEIMV